MVNNENTPENQPVRFSEVFDEVMRAIDPPSTDETHTPQEEFNAALAAYGQQQLRLQDGEDVSPEIIARAWDRLEVARQNLPDNPANQ